MSPSTDPRSAAVGDAVPAFRRLTGFHAWNRFAAVNAEFVSIHMDDEAGRAAGYPSALGMGNLQWSYLHCMLREWSGADGRISKLGVQFRAPNLKDATLTARGTVTRVSEAQGERTIELDVWVEDDEGQKLAVGQATLLA
jgi:acyl dehydratase